MRTPEDVLSPGDVAKASGVVPATVKTWAEKGWLPAIKTVGGRRLFKRADVDAFLAKRAKDRQHA